MINTYTSIRILTINSPKEFDEKSKRAEVLSIPVAFEYRETVANKTWYEALLEEAVAELEMNDAEAAKAVLKQAGKVAFGDDRYLVLLLQIAEAFETTDESIDVLKQLLEANPSQPDLWSKLGALYTKRNYFQGAITAYKRALTFEPTNVDLKTTLAGVYYLSKHTQSAVREAEGVYALTGSPQDETRMINWGREYVMR